MKALIDHIAIKNRLIEAGFTQPVQNKFGCWINKDSVICYYAANNDGRSLYAIVYKNNRYYFRDVNRLNSLIGTIYTKINASIRCINQ